MQHVLRTLIALGLSTLVACSAAACATSPDDGSTGDSKSGGSGGGGGIISASNPYGVTPAQCAASPAPAVVTNALCVCDDFTDVGNLIVSAASDHDLGSVGVNGETRVANNAHVSGSWASGKNFHGIGNVIIGNSLYTPADLAVAANVDVTKNLEVGGAMSGFGRVAVHGELGIRGANSVIGYQDIAAKGSYQDAPATPCGCKGDKGYLDVGAAIAAAKNKNDNAAKKIPSSLDNVGYNDVTFETGSYYFKGTTGSIGFSHIHVKGIVSMYIDGSLDQIGADVFDVAEGSTFDLYVGGAFRTIGHFSLGDRKNPGALRVFVGGTEDISVAIGNDVFRGSLYAPDSKIIYVGRTVVEGGLFVKTLSGAGDLEIHALRPTPAAGCTDAPPSGGDVGTPVIR